VKNIYKTGITIVELLIVFAIIAIMATVVFAQLAKTRENQVVKSAVADVLSVLNKARTQTLASLNSSEYGVRFESNKVIIFKGKVYSSSNLSNVITNIISPATISTITLIGGGAEIYFNRLSGAPSTSGSVVVSSPNFSKTITISPTGTSSVN